MGWALPGSAARSASIRVLTASCSAGLSGPRLEPLEAAAGMLQSVQAEISEVVSILRRYSDRVDLDPARLAEVERRMAGLMDRREFLEFQLAEIRKARPAAAA